MIYLLTTVFLLGVLFLYFRIADKYNIIDKPNNRSSHVSNTIRGGGIAFPVTMLFYVVLFEEVPLILLGGMLLISLVSFWDDIKSLPNKIRIFFHLVAVSALLFSVGAYQVWPWWLILIAYVLNIGTINAYNFMDGINGITGLYSLVILLGLIYINERVVHFTEQAFIMLPILACLVFLFFNFRKKARCFAGDVGSVGLGFWIISLLVMLITKTGHLEYILFLALYGVDSVLTIIHRLILKQNIFEAHRLHFYQLLANELKIPHLVVAATYGLLQLLINAFVIFTDFGFIVTCLLVLTPLSLLYMLLKPRWTPKVVMG